MLVNVKVTGGLNTYNMFTLDLSVSIKTLQHETCIITCTLKKVQCLLNLERNAEMLK